MFKYKYDFQNLSKGDLTYIGAANNLVFYFVWQTGLFFSFFGFQIGFSALNFLWGIPYYFYIASMLSTIISFVFKHIQYKKHNYFENKRKYVVDTIIYLLFLLAFFLNAYFFTTTEPVVDNFAKTTLNFYILIPVLIPLSVVFWIYMDYSAHKPVRDKYKEYKKAEKQLKQ